MAEGRMLKRTISRDGRVAQLSAHSALLYVQAIPHLDREGRMDGSPVAVRGTVAPARAAAHPSEWTDERIAEYMLEWTGTLDEDTGLPRPLVLHYCTRGVWVCHFLGFRSNQKLRFDRERPSSLPEPPAAMLAAFGITLDGDAVSPPADADSAVHPGSAVFAGGTTSRSADSGRLPDLVRTQAEAEVQVQDLPDQRGLSRAREADPHETLAALPENEPSEGQARQDEPFGDVVAAVARRRAGLDTHGPLGRLLALLHDADENTPRTLHALFDPLGEPAIDFACRELEAYGSEILRPSAYVVGIAKRLASPHRRRGRNGRRYSSGRDDLRGFREGEEQWERIEEAAARDHAEAAPPEGEAAVGF